MLVKGGRFPALPTVLLLLALLLTMIPGGTAFGDGSVEESSSEATATGEAPADEAAAPDKTAVDAPADEPVSTPVDDADVGPSQTTTVGQDTAAPPEPTGGGANTGGPYDSNSDGSPSQNGNGGGGDARPCAGCVGNADDKNPPGQLPGPEEDGDQGYECDGNSGVGKTNPAHSGCPDPAPAIHLEKDGPATSRIGDTITYTFKVTNTGNTTLTNVYVTDPLTGSGQIAVTPTTLPPGDSGIVVVATGTKNYTVRAADVVNNNVHNVATAHGTSPAGVVTDTDPHDVAIAPVVQTPHPSIEVVKNGPATAIIGETITYTFLVTNTGETTLTDVHITDPLIGTAQIAVTPSTLAVGATGTASATYTVRAQDMVHDRVPNTATAHGTPPSGPPVTDTDGHVVEILPKHTICHATGSANNPFEPITISVKAIFDHHLGLQHHDGRDIIPPFTYQNGTHDQNWPEGKALFENGCVEPPLVPEITLIKDGPAGAQVGETITYTFKVTNAGKTVLTNVHITDPLLGTGQIAVTPSTLAVGESGTATAQYTVDQADVVGLNVHNEATAIGTPPTGPNVTDVDPHDVTIVPAGPPAILLEKGGPAQANVGDTITYRFDVTNIGATELTNVHITDPLLGTGEIAVTPSTLAVGATGVATATYTIQDAAVVDQNLHNVATVHGTSPLGDNVTDDDPHDVLIPVCCPEPGSIQLVKGGPTGADIGSTITYTFDVTNTGPVTLTDVHVTDPLLGTSRIAVTPGTLPPGGTGTATARYTVRQADVSPDKMIHNVATVHGTTPDGRRVTDDDPHDVLTGTEQRPPEIFLEKGGPAGAEKAGDVITYTFNVTNTGGTTLTNVHITDPMLTDRTIAVTPSTLRVNEVGTAQATYTVTAADVRALEIYNEATVHGTAPNGRNVEDDDDHTVIIPAGARPGITLEKSGPATANVGDTITYRFSATNTGQTVLTNVTITDPMLGGELAVTPSTLAPGERGTASATYKVTAADGRRGEIFNTALVTGDPPTGPPVTDRDTHITDVPPDDVPPPETPELPATGADVPSRLLLAGLALLLGFGLLHVTRNTVPAVPATWSIQAPRLSGSQSAPPVHNRRTSGWSTPRMG